MKDFKLLQPTSYGSNVYSKNVYPGSTKLTPSDGLPEKITFFQWRIVSNNSQTLEGDNITKVKTLYNKIEFKWNFVKDAVGYALYKGNSPTNLTICGYTKANFYFLFEQIDNAFFYYQVRPLFDSREGV